MFSELELEYDKFNGSVADLADRAADNSMDSMTCETTNESEISSESILVVPKNRDSNTYPLRIASHFTASKRVPTPEEHQLDELAKSKDELAVRVFKIGKEIAFLETIMPKMERSVELDKLEYAKGKLEEMKEEFQRQQYTLSIKINRLEKKIYGAQGSKADYWVRGVSS
ncbi:hypothetical protein KL905_003900 [Ogataea polymorpha]|nr:hypothetical protein KL937_004000 [Ogataea polymorpha]KAG7890225.1 hypothetical protein KL908_004563 [Ogataea polymorpha]KAG7895391.1 hypothetical protein KL936_000099 [Ogataea polymorpha]KAG7901581.1 hypothetical protein KL907_004251 [Ogataea polymorpha]KAG7907076.1 hypothetical protein KL906_004262 [Ogataea polymorpha]